MGWLFRLRRWFNGKMHDLDHKMGNNSGSMTTWFEPADEGIYERLMIGFKCDVCGKMSGVHESSITAAMRQRKGRYRDV